MRPFCVLMLLVVLLLQSCGRQEANSGCSLSLDYYKTLGTASYRVDSRVVRESIRRIIKSDADSMVADKQAKSYYLKGNSFVWIDRLGVDSRADTLLAYLRTVEADGLSANRFCVGLIEADLNRMRTLDFDSCGNDINHVAGRLEYRLTKA
ncbi:MAG: L,D-transpeptidase, partial [Prevotella sp.]|nr:L,D-transpeptidase [Prevotella sp.]